MTLKLRGPNKNFKIASMMKPIKLMLILESLFGSKQMIYNL